MQSPKDPAAYLTLFLSLLILAAAIRFYLFVDRVNPIGDANKARKERLRAKEEACSAYQEAASNTGQD